MEQNLEQDNKFVKSLILNAQYGNNSAFEQLFQLNVGRVYALSLRLTTDENLAEELTQKSFIEAWTNISHHKEDLTFATWLASVAINLFADIYFPLIKNTPDDKKSILPVSEKKIENNIYALPLFERAVFVIHVLENYSIERTATLLSLELEETNKYLENANSLIKENLHSIPKKVEPKNNLWHGVFNKIHEIKVDKGQEEEELNVEIDEVSDSEKEELKKLEVIERKKQRQLKVTAFKAKLYDEYKKPYFRAIYIVLGLVVLAVIAYLIFSGGEKWEVKSLAGSPYINQESFSSIASFSSGDKLTTNNLSEASFNIPGIGSVLIGRNTSITREGKYSFSIETGSIKVNKENAVEFLKVKTPSAEITDFYLGGSYDLDVSQANSTLVVEESWVMVTGKNNNAIVLPGHYIQIQNDKIGIPYNKTSSETFKLLINDYSFSNDAGLVQNIISSANILDAVSLWHLIKRVDRSNRNQIFQVLYNLTPPPKSVTKEGILDLDEEMMRAWLEEIEMKI